jgi:uracil-DNA glycosylase
MTNIAIIGEAWGQEELKARAPFVGYSGQELTRMLYEAGISRGDCLITNVFNLHPPGNDIGELCGPKSTGLLGYPALKGTRHVRSEYVREIERLGDEIIDANPNVIIALGNTRVGLARPGHVRKPGSCNQRIAQPV